MNYPQLNAPEQSMLVTQSFPGYDHNLRGREGAMYHMQNLSGRHYPLLSTRKPRLTVREMADPGGLIAKDALYWVDDGVFYANGLPVAGFHLEKGEKQLISMGAYIVIWPDRQYINTQDLTDFGAIDHTFTTQGDVTLTLCKQDGEAYDLEEATLAASAPENPQNGQLWVDTAQEAHILNQYAEATGEWVQIPTVYLRMEAPGIGQGFAAFDGVTVSGLSYTGDSPGLQAQVEALNGDTILQGAGEDYVVFTGLLDQVLTLVGVTLKRQAPAMDYLCESGNRLWGCRYGMEDGKPINEIYASKLGDFKNWKCFMGLSTDSYAVSLGTDGVFTGAVSYQGYPVFFKEGCLHRIYGSQPSAYQLQTLLCQGVARDSAKSLCQVGGALYYKSRSAVMAYDGSLPQIISQPLGEARYQAGVGGSLGALYYLSLLDESGEPHLFVYDTAKSLWYREDCERPISFAQLDDRLYWLTAAALKQQDGGEETMPWQAVTAAMGYDYPQQK
ncbi:MAG: hypothetical protein IJ461_08875, partial [Clostridia bacterium]|nr:hypothetical protein [Clostridia bacterium]